jgi:hypothetical protein
MVLGDQVGDKYVICSGGVDELPGSSVVQWKAKGQASDGCPGEQVQKNALDTELQKA